jgi:ATP-binding cassette subfamily B protein/subfamily B ATP-binding cassette protein MsbA
VLSRRESSRTRYATYREKLRAEKPQAISHRLEEPSKKKRSRNFFELFGTFWTLIRPYRPSIYLALTTLSIVCTLSLAMPASSKIAVDYIWTDNPGPTGIPEPFHSRLPQDRMQLLWMLGGVMIAVALLSVLIGMVGRWQMTRITKRLQVQLRKDAFEHAGKLPLHRIHHYKSGGMSSLLREDAGSTAELLFNMIYNPWQAIVRLAGTLIVLAFIDWKMLVGSLLLIPALWITHKTWIGRIRPMYRDTKLVRQVIDSTTTEAFGGMRVVRGFNREQAESVRFTTSQHYLARLEVLIWWWSRLLEGVWAVFIPVALAAVMVYGGREVIQHRMTVGDVFMFSSYVMMLLGPMEVLTSTATNIQTNLAALDRVLDLLGEEQEFGGQRTGKLVSRQTAYGRIELKDVWFTYPKPSKRALAETLTSANVSMNGTATGSRPVSTSSTTDPAAAPVPEPSPVIRGISLQVQAGQTIALVGPSGSGKTTLCNLIARFYDATRGSIFFDGTDLKDIDVRSYRNLLGIVEQDVFLFDGTIAENIAYARRDATEQQVIEAARAANAHDFIQELDKGYNTMIGERGVRLSGGQKQRIAIARALLADPLILILDEATSNLDSESEGLIQRSLATLMQGRTAFVIAHRLSTVRSADLIVVLDKGEVIEQGTHEQLNARGGRYAELLRIQVEGHGVQRPGATVVPAVSSVPPTTG